MKKSPWIIMSLLIAGIGYVVASPLITINQIKSGIEEQDSEQLSENIDFPVLRQNMKEQFNAVMMREAVSELEESPFGALAIGFASNLVDAMVDSFVTPSGLASLMEGEKPSKNSSEPSSDSVANKQIKKELFKSARYSYDSTSKFSVWVPNDNGEEIRFVMYRNGIEWKLANIIIPMDKKPWSGAVKKEGKNKGKNKGESIVLTKDKPDATTRSAANSGSSQSPTNNAPVQPDESSKDISKNGSGWTVRVGTYAKIENVDKVSALLNSNGFKAQHAKVQTTLGAATRIWLGPYTKKKTAEEVSMRLKLITGEKGYVTKTST